MKCYTISSFNKANISPYIAAEAYVSGVSTKTHFQVIVGNSYGIKKRLPLSVALAESINPNFVGQVSLNVPEAKISIGGQHYPVLDVINSVNNEVSSKSALVKIDIHSSAKNLKLTSASYDCRPDDFDMFNFVNPAHVMNSQFQNVTSVSNVLNGLYVSPHTPGLFESGATDLDATLMTKYEEGIYIMPPNSVIRVMEYILCFYGNGYFNWAVEEHYIKWTGMEFFIYTADEFTNELTFDKSLKSIVF